MSTETIKEIVLPTRQESLREAYGEILAEIGQEDSRIVVLDADLSCSTKTATFAKKFPQRFFNMGVAEQDMVGTAAGLAIGGKIPFASTFAIFQTGRAWEQIRQAICYPKTNVKLVASHAGITVGEDGASHHCIEDLALMRVLPGMTVIVPADANETRGAIKAAVKYKGPVYIRLARDKFPVIYEKNHLFTIGKGDRLVEGGDAAIIATGLMVSAALEAAYALLKQGIEISVVNISTIKPLDKELIISLAAECGAIVSAEEHSYIGGLGSAVAEVLSEERPTPLIRIGMPDRYAFSGKPQQLLEYFGLTAANLEKAVKQVIKKKKL
ncbi:MAG: transketolase family protein [Candidatus Schekmanbacteria bacterium]|nr:transketolase family protein [Candidatus Schekmanbacteria bacterium]